MEAAAGEITISNRTKNHVRTTHSQIVQEEDREAEPLGQIGSGGGAISAAYPSKHRKHSELGKTLSQAFN